jgi:hypothetical protein
MRRHFDSLVTRLANAGFGEVFFVFDGAYEFVRRGKLLIPRDQPDSVSMEPALSKNNRDRDRKNPR